MRTTETDPPAFQQAVLLHGQGRLPEAEKLYKQVLRRNNRHFDSLYRLGLLRLQQNRFADAEPLFRRATHIDAASPDAQHHLAIALTGTGRFEDAVVHYHSALKLQPRDAAAHNNLAYTLQKLDRRADAEHHCRQALALNPNYAEAHNNLGNALQSLGRTDEAIAHYRRALMLRPAYAEAYSNLASALAVNGLHQEAVENCRKALALNPGNAQAHMNLANSLGALERLQDALAHYQKAIAIDPVNVEAHSRASSMLFHLGHIQEAVEQCDKALAIDPGHAESLKNFGVAQQALGRLDEAAQAFEKAIAATPKKAAGYYCLLANSKKMLAADPHFAAMRELANDIEALDKGSRIGLHFALAKAYADTGDHARSFTHLVAGNALKRQEFAEHDESAQLNRFARIGAAFPAELLRQRKDAGDPSSLPVFIVGMPRSGTSLVEQILASHPKVFGAGERYNLGELAQGIKGPSGAEFPEAVAGLADETLRTLGASYVEAMRALAPQAARVTDKMPTNFFFAGLIHLALPNARIIHIHRDPRDVAMSCFSTLFAMGHPHTYDLAELGRYIRAYETLMAHWRQVLPASAMIEVQYEQLVADLENEAKRIVDFCDLEWDDACLSFYASKRPVRTASVVQVRQPIYNSSVGRWRPYACGLEPFLRALSGT